MTDTAALSDVETAPRAERAVTSETTSPSNAIAPDAGLMRKIYVEAFRALKAGASPADAAQRLATFGLDAGSSAAVVANVETFIRDLDAAYRAAGLKSAGIGLLWCIGGILVTAATYQAAANGGTYFVAWGAVVFGGIQAVRGLVHSLRRASEDQLVQAFRI